MSLLILRTNCSAYHPRGVLKGRCSVNKNDIFEFSVVGYPRSRSDLERGPPTVSKKNFNKIQWKNNVREQKKINRFAQDSNLSRLISTLLSPSPLCQLFCLTRYSYFIIQSSNEWIFKLHTITGHHKTGSPQVYCSITSYVSDEFHWEKNRHHNREQEFDFYFFMLIILFVRNSQRKTSKWKAAYFQFREIRMNLQETKLNNISKHKMCILCTD